MKKLLVLTGIAALLVSTSSASALVNFLINGDFSNGETGWTRWTAGRGSPTWSVPNESSSPPVGKLNVTTAGGVFPSFGWYQIVPVPAGLTATLSGQWANSNPGWQEYDYKTYAAPPSDATIKNDLDAAITNASVAWKDNGGSGTTPGYPSLITAANRNGFSGGNNGVLTSLGYVVVLLKLGNVNGASIGYFDNITVTPEPSTLLLLAAPSIVLLRRRRRLA